jgi:hypothetical protein
MNPALILMALSVLEKIVSMFPGIAVDLKAIFNNPSPTPADWQAIKAKVKAKSYADYVPASALDKQDAPPIDQAQNILVPSTLPAVLPYLEDGSRNPDFQHL